MAASSREKANLLSQAQYDDDAASFRTPSAQDDHSDSEDERLIREARSSAEVARHDKEVLREEAEAEELLSNERRGLAREPVRAGRANQEKRNKRKNRESLYEMEEGGHSEPLRDSSESDRQRLGTAFAVKSSRRSRACRYAAIYVGIAALFLILLYAAYKASPGAQRPDRSSALSNGTSEFPPTTIVISLDGFRADFLQRGLTPTLNSFIQKGVSPLYMLPSFPSVTFPNHFTLVTGLYPESHGIVGNTFWDPLLEEDFHYTDPSRSMQPKWWGGEPLWVTAEKQGIRTAIHMWPGSEAHIGGVEPTYVDKYSGKEKLSNKVDRILQLLDIPGPEHPDSSRKPPRPRLIAAYVPVVDSDGHKYGPNSTEIRQTITAVDDMLAGILTGLDERNLAEVVNIIVVSDHGMATTDTHRLIQLDDLVDVDLIEHMDGWPLYGLRLKDPANLVMVAQQLRQKALENPNFDVYLRDEDMPERYHFSNNDRIAPLWVMPKAGWAIVTKKDFDVESAIGNGDVYHPRGLHGYDHEHPLMRAIFVARGPAFPHTPGSRVENFQNIEVYNIICDSLGIRPNANNGTLRLPFVPVGLHSDEEGPTLEIPADPSHMTEESASASTSTFDHTSHTEGPVTSETQQAAPEGPEPNKNQTETPTIDESAKKKQSWWQWVTEKANDAKQWAKDLFGKTAYKGAPPD